jgi:hypothetical protein
MPQKKNPCEIRAARVAKQLFIFKLFWVGIFFINSLQSSYAYHQLEKVLRYMELTRKNVERSTTFSQIPKKN